MMKKRAIEFRRRFFGKAPFPRKKIIQQAKNEERIRLQKKLLGSTADVSK